MLLLAGCSAQVDGGAADLGDMGMSPDLAGADAAGVDAAGSDLAGPATTSDLGGPADFGSAVIPTAHPRIYLSSAQLARLKGLANDPAAKRFAAMVDDQLAGGNVYNFQAWFAALMYQLTGDQKYSDYAIKQVDDFVTSEEALIASNQVAQVAGDSYLYVGDDIGDLAIVYDWCYDRLTQAQRDRWLAYADQAVWNVWHPADAKWGTTSFPWSGWSVDNPVNNYYYSFLRATVLLGLASSGEDAQAATWIDTFRNAKIGNELLPTFDRDLVGGGSREGTGYGTAMEKLFGLYDIWQSSTGEQLAPQTSHTLSSLAFMIHETVPTLDRVAPIGDQARDSTASLFDYHRDYLQALTWLFASDPLAARGRWWLANCSVPQMTEGFMYWSDFFYAQPGADVKPLDDLYPTYYASGTGNVFARSSWAKDATWMHFIAGPYTESHAHHDQGSFLIYENEWLAYDQNIQSHSGLAQSVTAHNLVRVEQGGTPIEMTEGTTSTLLALQDEPGYLYLAADLTPAYGGSVGHIDREIVWLKPKVFVIFDRVQAAGDTRVWQLSTPISPSVSGQTVTLQGQKQKLTLYAAGTPSVVDWKSADTDMLGGYRVDVSDATGDTSHFLSVIVLDDSAAAPQAADQTGKRGVTLSLKDGRTVTVRFNQDAPGATLDDGTFNGTLPMSVETLPLFH